MHFVPPYEEPSHRVANEDTGNGTDGFTSPLRDAVFDYFGWNTIKNTPFSSFSVELHRLPEKEASMAWWD